MATAPRGTAAGPPPESLLHAHADGDPTADEAALAEVMKTVPRGALGLAGIAVALLLAAWLAVYLFVFLPRGPVG